ncbi:MAG: DUF456 domain-containing protein [Planctomycetes bacterium]|nr:DUF456 domain-containing protein [Planctomycetota bacterium]
MIYLFATALILLNTCWLALVIFSLPGNWFMLISTFTLAWWQKDSNIFSIYTLIVITLLACLGEIIEFIAAATGAKKAGASWLGSLCAIIGAVTGAIIGTFIIPVPVLGTLLGACSGAGLGVLGIELLRGKELKETVRYGIGAGIGEFIGITSKFALGILIWLIIAVAAFWP